MNEGGVNEMCRLTLFFFCKSRFLSFSAAPLRMQVWGILPRFYTHLAVPICRPPTQRSAACTQALSLLRLKRHIVISEV